MRLLNNNNNNKEKTDLELTGLKGKVKTMTHSTYSAVERFGEVYKDTIISFNSSVFLRNRAMK